VGGRSGPVAGSVSPSLRAVLEAVGSIAADLDLHETLQRIVDAATLLANATYGALGMLDERRGSGGRLRDFVTSGITQEQRDRIGPRPEGHGILGVLIDHPEPLLVDDLSRHELAAGFPPHHPPMTTFLGAPIRIGDRVFGNLYLTERRGGGPFTVHDSELVVAFATAAGVVIENARLYEEQSHRRRWLEAAAAVSDRLLGKVGTDHPPDVIVEQAMAAGDADGVVVLLTSGRGTLRVTGAAGALIDPTAAVPDPDGRTRTGLELAETVLRTGTSVTPIPSGDLLVRLGATERVAGVLWLRWSGDRLARVPETIAASVERFAEQVALALEVALAEGDRARLAVFEDRDRIGRDLHDQVIQRLFAVGLTLENTTRLAADPRIAGRLNTAVDQLDETIKDIRRTIYELGNPQRPADLRDEVDVTVTEMLPSLGFHPKVRTNGAVHSGVSDRVRPHLLAVLRESLSNIGRHAGASSASVTLEVTDEVVLTVSDDGRGIANDGQGTGNHRGTTENQGTTDHQSTTDNQGPLHEGNGLPNMRARAEELGGSCEIFPGRDAGVTLVWRVPAN
jgi:signal transduction histidine kinase